MKKIHVKMYSRDGYFEFVIAYKGNKMLIIRVKIRKVTWSCKTKRNKIYLILLRKRHAAAY